MKRDRKCPCGGDLYTKSNYCKSCAKSRMSSRRKSLLEAGYSKQDVYNYSWRLNNFEKYLLQSAKNRAKKKSLDFNIDVSDIVIPDKCPVLGTPFEIRLSKKGEPRNNLAPSLDRIDCSKGYVKGNVRVISWRANNLISDGTLQEFKKIVEYLDES